ncbi:unnamed protein product [Musa hybrid cultivar]
MTQVFLSHLSSQKTEGNVKSPVSHPQSLFSSQIVPRNLGIMMRFRPLCY